MTKPIIRNATLGDYQALCALFAQSNEAHRTMRPDMYREVPVAIPQSKYSLAILARDWFSYQPVSLQVAEHRGQVVGTVYVESESRSALSWSAFEKEAVIDQIVVDPAYRRLGIATALVNAGKAWAKATGHQKMRAKIITLNDASLGLFKKAGFINESVNVGLTL